MLLVGDKTGELDDIAVFELLVAFEPVAVGTLAVESEAVAESEPNTAPMAEVAEEREDAEVCSWDWE